MCVGTHTSKNLTSLESPDIFISVPFVSLPLIRDNGDQVRVQPALGKLMEEKSMCGTALRGKAPLLEES